MTAVGVLASNSKKLWECPQQARNVIRKTRSRILHFGPRSFSQTHNLETSRLLHLSSTNHSEFVGFVPVDHSGRRTPNRIPLVHWMQHSPVNYFF
jgi:hypothetical protein